MRNEDTDDWKSQLQNIRRRMTNPEDFDQSEILPQKPRFRRNKPHQHQEDPFVNSPIPEPISAKPESRKGPSTDRVETKNGILTVKSPNSEAVIQLTDAQQSEFVEKAMQYQQAIIKEKKASTISTYAMAALSGLSAVAIGVTLIRSVGTKGPVSLPNT